ncbi:hypothetical protein H257_03798 [Aphanomyces astaci]|uniref:Expansin-like EG45 domain-containing protein n=1 Tax=Aphanomyces astaci TaxID=112090 RepID=W4GZA5_APHAT|nr:hypothetical protein H257_03798 [Aphanomyces astaci]ETV84656.1 hypothetical protein H257_03798 [Aphanomyces astaci]|eukprot:XP_009826348.1 hypothetical protein H257_03798 [Aphanomyces astaci]
MVMRRLHSAVALLAVGLAPTDGFSGDVTAYSDKWQGGNCGFNSVGGDGQSYFAALNAPQWGNKMQCGRCARVACVSPACASRPAIIVAITDQCPECKTGDLDLSIQSFKALTGHDPARYKIDWQFVECPVEFVKGSLEFDVKEGSNAFWWALQPRNFAQPIRSVELKAQGRDWVTLVDPTTNGIDAFFFLDQDKGGLPGGPCQIRTTSTSGEVLVESFDQLPTSGTLYGTKQFTRTSTTVGQENPNPSSTTKSPSSSNPPSASTTSTPTSTRRPDDSIATATQLTATTTLPPITPSSPRPSPSSGYGGGLPHCNPSTVSYELKQGQGGFALQVYITEASNNDSWTVDATASAVTTSYITGIYEPWNCEWSRTNATLHLKPVSSRRSFGGPNHVGVLGNTTDVLILTSITFSTPSGACSIPSVVGTSPIGFAAAEMSEEGPSAGAIVGVSAATIGLVAAVVMVIRVRRQAKANTPGFGGMLTPIDFAVSTPVAVL